MFWNRSRALCTFSLTKQWQILSPVCCFCNFVVFLLFHFNSFISFMFVRVFSAGVFMFSNTVFAGVIRQTAQLPLLWRNWMPYCIPFFWCVGGMVCVCVIVCLCMWYVCAYVCVQMVTELNGLVMDCPPFAPFEQCSSGNDALQQLGFQNVTNKPQTHPFHSFCFGLG